MRAFKEDVYDENVWANDMSISWSGRLHGKERAEKSLHGMRSLEIDGHVVCRLGTWHSYDMLSIYLPQVPRLRNQVFFRSGLDHSIGRVGRRYYYPLSWLASS